MTGLGWEFVELVKMCLIVALASISMGVGSSTSAVREPLSSSYDTKRGPAPQRFHICAYKSSKLKSDIFHTSLYLQYVGKSVKFEISTVVKP